MFCLIHFVGAGSAGTVILQREVIVLHHKGFGELWSCPCWPVPSLTSGPFHPAFSSFVNGFETCAFASEEEEEEEFPASQAAAREEEKLEAVRCYIRSNTALYNRILFYEPIELADLHAELKQNGIKISKAKLLNFLDSQCITSTMAKARKEKEQKRKESRKQRRRYRVKPTHPP